MRRRDSCIGVSAGRDRAVGELDLLTEEERWALLLPVLCCHCHWCDTEMEESGGRVRAHCLRLLSLLTLPHLLLSLASLAAGAVSFQLLPVLEVVMCRWCWHWISSRFTCCSLMETVPLSVLP